jgi:hypothetical protein
VATAACLALSTATACTTTSVTISARVARAEKATYGSSWPFKADSVVARCDSATGHPVRLSISVDSATYAVDGPAGQGLPDDIFRVGGRRDFPTMYVRLITGC